MKKNALDQKTQSAQQSHTDNIIKSAGYDNAHLSELQGAIVDQLELMQDQKCLFKTIIKRMKDAGYTRTETINAINELSAGHVVKFSRSTISRSHCVPPTADAIGVYVELVGGDQ